MGTAPFNCFAIAAPGLEPLLSRELTALGEHARIAEGGGGVGWEGDLQSIMRANLWLRTASRVVVRVASFKATAFYELEKRARKIPWEQFVSPGRAAEFRVTTRKSKLYHSDAIAERLVSAIGTKRSKRGRASSAHAARGRDTAERADAATQLFIVRVVRDEFTISADTSGELLHVRGYRREVGKAPLRETLAAALLIAADWNGETPLLDPLCGSGTISIEGALLARSIPPGLRRRFAFMDWPGYEPSRWETIVEAARKGILKRPPAPILGSDRDAGAVASAAANATRAGVANDIEFSARAISGIQPPDVPGLIATNPPYGVRVGSREKLRDLYAQLGHVLRRRCPGWRVALYSSDRRLTRETALPFHETLRTSNGGIKVAAVISEVPGLSS